MSHTNPLDRLTGRLTARLAKNAKAHAAWLARDHTTCWRAYDRDHRDLPLVLDVYGDALHAAYAPYAKSRLSKDDLDALLGRAAEALDLDPAAVFLKQRKRQRGGGQYTPVARDRAERVVTEHGLRFKVNLSDYLDTGLFLDHRATRATVGAQSRGKRVLNLFAYTGAFTVHAAAGGASHTTTVDMSNTYTQWARDNLALNGLDGGDHRVLQADVMRFLRNPERVREPLYDIVVIDPPTFSRSKRMERDFDVQRDHAWLVNKSLDLTATSGTVYFSTNFRKFRFDPKPFARRAAIRELTPDSIPPDISDRRIHRCWELTRR